MGVGFAFPDVTAQLLLAAARFQFPPLLTMDGDDTKSHFLPPPPRPTAVAGRGCWRRPEKDRRRGGGRRRGASPAPPPARTPLAARTPAFHTRAHSRPRAAAAAAVAVPRLLQRRPPQTLPCPPRRPPSHPASATGALIVAAIPDEGWISPPGPLLARGAEWECR